MLIIMKRTQTTDLGKLCAGVAYRFDAKKPGHKACVEDLLDRGMAEKTTEKDLEKNKGAAEKVSRELIAAKSKKQAITTEKADAAE